MFDDKPALFEDLQLVWDAYEELALCRQWRPDGEPCGLNHSEISDWLDLNLINDPTYRNSLYRNIKSMDIAWMAIRRKKLTESCGNTTRSNRRSKRKRRR